MVNLIKMPKQIGKQPPLKLKSVFCGQPMFLGRTRPWGRESKPERLGLSRTRAQDVNAIRPEAG